MRTLLIIKDPEVALKGDVKAPNLKLKIEKKKRKNVSVNAEHLLLKIKKF